MLEGILIVGAIVGMLFVAWFMFCLLLKGMFRIADWVFGL